MPAQILRLDYARQRTLGVGAVLKLLEKAATGYKVTQTVTQGFHVGRVFDRARGALVDTLLLDETAAVTHATIEHAIAVDLVKADASVLRYTFDSGKPPAIGVLKNYSVALRANFGDKTPYEV